MSEYSFVELPQWVKDVERRLDAVVVTSTSQVIELASRTKPGKSRGGAVTPGFVPVDTGFLANSLVSTLHGTTTLTQKGDYYLVVGSMKAGDVAEFGWAAEYARAVHYRGWLWRDVAVQQWPDIVRRNVARLARRIF